MLSLLSICFRLLRGKGGVWSDLGLAAPEENIQLLNRNEISDNAFGNVTPARHSVLQVLLRLSLLPRATESEFLGLKRLLLPRMGLAAEPLRFLHFLSAVWTFMECLRGS